MGLASALSTALTGLNAAETTIDVVGNNVANSNTVGFKASGAVFATQFQQTLSLGSGPTETRGGTDNSVTRISMKPTHLIGGYAQLSYGFNYYGPTGTQRDEMVAVRKLLREVAY